ncbi:hypothetical protein F4774DRAFT_410672 [Daldinia eschscholtzii]|nr:hypothetical protein F4774DRAFT_410672 [Daldinia eschscholtzii]
MSANRGIRLTHKSLPELIIPLGSRRVEPEEITASRVEGFLRHCDKNKKAPITRLPDIAHIPPPGTLDTSIVGKGGNKKGIKPLNLPSIREELEDPNTLAFTDCESDRLDYLQAELARAKELHKDLYLETHIDPNNREVMEKCREARKRREELNNEISGIYRRREIRRQFRRDANHPKGVANW